MREMENILANLAETLREAQRAKALAARPKSKRAPRPLAVDSPKNRLALFSAIDSTSIDQLGALVERGVPLDGRKDGATLLAHCAKRRWEEGFSMLLQAGASPTWTPELGQSRLPRRGSWSRAGTLLQAMAEDSFAYGLDALWEQSDPLDIAKAISLMDSHVCWLFLDRRGIRTRMDLKRTVKIASHLLSRCAEDVAPERTHFARMKEACSWTPEQRTSLWIGAIRQNNPAVVEFASRQGVAPFADGSIRSTPRDFIKMNIWPLAASYLPWTVEDFSCPFEERPEPVATTPRTFTFVELVCASSPLGTGNFAALAELPEFAAQIGSSPFALHCLASSKPAPATLKALAGLGLDLPSVVDGQERNPLHLLVASGGSHTQVEQLARTCEPWIHQRDLEGKTPIDHAWAPAKQALAITFDKIAMRAGLGGKRGAKAKPKRI